MAYTASDLTARIAALETALDRHERSVKFADREDTYASASEIIDKINYFKSQLATVRRRARQSTATTDKGLA